MIKARRMNHDHIFSQMPSSTIETRSLPDLCPEVENTKKKFATLEITCEEVETQNILTKKENTDRVVHTSVPSSPIKLNVGITTNILQKNDIDDSESIYKSTNKFSTQNRFNEFTDISLSNSSDEEKSPKEEIGFRRDSIVDSVFNWMSPAIDISPENKVVTNKSFPKKAPTSFKLNTFIKNKIFKTKTIEPLSTTALILEDRPRNLPKKPLLESEKHKIEYERMVALARKNEIKEVEQRQKKLKEQIKQEESIAQTGVYWQNEILPNWSQLYQTTKVKLLWWKGLPPSVRGNVWRLTIGNDLNITNDLYDIMVSRSREKLKILNKSSNESGIKADSKCQVFDRENTVELIRLDVSRTFPKLCIFQKGGPYYDVLHDILGAYVCYRPDVGYVQGMSFIAGMLLLNMEPFQVFKTFANLLNRPCQQAFYRLNEEMMKCYFATFEIFFEENIPQLFAHFKHNNLTPDMYLIDWIFTMFSKSLSLDTTSRIWDVYCRDGEEFLFKTAIGLLRQHQSQLLCMDFIQAAQFLVRMPPSCNSDDTILFHNINQIYMTTSRNNKNWGDVFSLMTSSQKPFKSSLR